MGDMKPHLFFPFLSPEEGQQDHSGGSGPTVVPASKRRLRNNLRAQGNLKPMGPSIVLHSCQPSHFQITIFLRSALAANNLTGSRRPFPIKR